KAVGDQRGLPHPHRHSVAAETAREQSIGIKEDPMSIHPDDPKWTAYVLGELGDAERAEVERELESSAEARELVDEIRMTTVLLKDELAEEAPVALHARQREAIIAPVRASARRLAWGIPRWVFTGAAAATVAALIVVGVMMPSMLRSRQAAMSTSTDVDKFVQLPSTESSLPPGVQGQHLNQAAPVVLFGTQRKDAQPEE